MGAHARETDPLLDSDGGSGACADLKACFWSVLPGILGAAAALLIMVPILYWPYQWSVDDGKYPEYSVAVAGFSGLDPERDLSRPTLDPTFDLTVRIKEPRRWSAECVQRGTVATVSYRGVAMAHGPVPEFCARNENTTEVKSVMAWGNAVPVPRFARDRLADELRRGGAAVDVTLKAPARYCQTCRQKIVDCKVGVGRSEASPPCRVADVIPSLPDDPRKRAARRQLRGT